MKQKKYLVHIYIQDLFTSNKTFIKIPQKLKNNNN